MSNREFQLLLPGGTFCLAVGSEGRSITSNLHYESLEKFLESGNEEPGELLDDQFNYGRYEGAIDALESLILAAAQSGIDVQGEQFMTTLQTTLDAIGNIIWPPLAVGNETEPKN